MSEEIIRDREIRMRCVEIATRIIGSPEYYMVGEKMVRHQENLVKVATSIYNFIHDKQ